MSWLHRFGLVWLCFPVPAGLVQWKITVLVQVWGVWTERKKYKVFSTTHLFWLFPFFWPVVSFAAFVFGICNYRTTQIGVVLDWVGDGVGPGFRFSAVTIRE